MATICLDIGGTKIAGAVVRKNKVSNRKKIPTPKKSLKEFLSTISDLISDIAKGGPITSINICVPSFFNAKKGIVLESPNLPWPSIPLGKFIKKEFGIFPKIQNDANCFALGQLHFGKGYKNFACLTLGTGIGSGLILDGKLYTGRGAASELGHTIVKPDGLRCSCGNIGCIESYIAKRAFEMLSNERFGEVLTPKELAVRARKGDRKAKAIFNEIGRYLGILCANITNALDVEAIILGGGISKAGDLLITPARRSMKNLLFVPKEAKILRSTLQDATLLGASKL